MKMYQWNCLNSEGALLKKIYTGTKDIEVATKKLVALYGENSVFVELKYKGEVDMN